MAFETDDHARTNADTRNTLDRGPAPGQGGDFGDRFAVKSVTADGKQRHAPRGMRNRSRSRSHSHRRHTSNSRSHPAPRHARAPQAPLVVPAPLATPHCPAASPRLAWERPELRFWMSASASPPF